MAVEFKEIERYPGYRFGSDGSIWTRLARDGSYKYREIGEWRPLKTLAVNSKGYRVASLRNADGAYHSLSVHRLIAEAFHGPCPVGKECCHNDGIRANCAASNLRWGTRSENFADKHRHGTASTGEKSPNARLSNAQAYEIRRRAGLGEGQRALAREFGVTLTIVHNIVKGRTYRGG